MGRPVASWRPGGFFLRAIRAETGAAPALHQMIKLRRSN
jgi:hypothetical protein